MNKWMDRERKAGKKREERRREGGLSWAPVFFSTLGPGLRQWYVIRSWRHWLWIVALPSSFPWVFLGKSREQLHWHFSEYSTLGLVTKCSQELEHSAWRLCCNTLSSPTPVSPKLCNSHLWTFFIRINTECHWQVSVAQVLCRGSSQMCTSL